MKKILLLLLALTVIKAEAQKLKASQIKYGDFMTASASNELIVDTGDISLYYIRLKDSTVKYVTPYQLSGIGTITNVLGTTNRITVTGTTVKTVDIASTYVGQTSITTLGTITTGTWQGASIANSFLANSTISGISLGNNLTDLTIGSNLQLNSGSTYNGSTAKTISLQNAAADGSTKGAASFNASDFDASSGNISIDYVNSGIYKSGGTDVPITDGGTGSSTAAGARGNLGITSAIAVGTITELSPAAGSTYYFGFPSMSIYGQTTTADIRRIYIPYTGTITGVYMTAGIRSTLGTAAQTGTLSINYNNGSYTTIGTSDFSNRENLFSNSSLSISVTAGNYIEFKIVYPTPWTTAATNISWFGYVLISY